MSTQLVDLYHPLPFEEGVDEAAAEKNAFIRSGVLSEYEEITSLADAGGLVGELPFYKPLDVATEPNYTSDIPTTHAVPDKITTGTQVCRLAKLHKSWGTMDFARELTLREMDPLNAISAKVGQYWATQEQRRLVAAAVGLLADNVITNNGDMVVDIFTDIAAPTGANIISAEALLDTRQTAGDSQVMFNTIAMHSVTFNTLNKQNLIAFVPDSQGIIDFPTYLNMSVIVDDQLPTVMGTHAVSYTSIIFASGAFGYGAGRSKVPSELERVPSSGDGGGQYILHSRRNPLIHPFGFAFNSAGVVNTATLAQLQAATAWSRVVNDRKSVGIAALIHNN